ncbi:MAG: GIY-YIG nuclease family protein [Candidatus Omnitrophota bacterium]|nr:GIY-YIG nuclease family protein [Candidatus Omnitrophota bacterium]
MYYIYALYSEKFDRLYVGMTNNLKRRIYEHNIGKMKATSACRPWLLFYWELASDRINARKREKQLKSGSGREFLKSRLEVAPVAQSDRATAF